MAARTISIFHGYYTALQGYWDWDKSKGFVFVSRPRPDQSPSCTSPRQDTPSAQVPCNTPSNSDPSTTQSANDSYDSLTKSTTSDSNNPDDDTEPSSLDSSLCSIEFEPPSKLRPLQDNFGLGISGLLKKDGSGPFTGLGIVSVHSSSWRHIPLSPVIVSNGGADNAPDETRSSWDVSETMLQETLLTFNEGSFLGHALESIPESESWYSTKPMAPIDPQASSTITSNLSQRPQFVSSLDRRQVGRCARPGVALTRDLTLPTISSELRRVTGPRSDILFPSVSRSRSCLYAPDSVLSANSIRLSDPPKTRRSFSDPSLAKNLRLARAEGSGLKERAYIRRRAASASEGSVGMPRGGSGLVCVGGRTLPRWR